MRAKRWMVVAALGAGCLGNVDEVGESAAPLATTTVSQAVGLTDAPAARIDFGVEVDPGVSPPAQEWTERVRSPLFWGGAAELRASASRFPSCGVGGEVSLGLRFDDGRVLEVDAQTDPYGATARFTVPAGPRAVELWWRAADGECVEYDSDFARNYRFDVFRWAPTVVRFGDDWSEVAERALQRGGVLAIDYDLDRLTTCRGVYRGFSDWYVRANGRFGATDFSADFAQELTGHEYDERGIPTGVVRSDLAIVPIPWDATEIELWFDNGQKIIGNGCRAWDSDFGRNYRFVVEEAREAIPSACFGLSLVDAGDGTKTAVVTDRAAIEHFVARSEETFETTVEYSGVVQTVTVQRRFPWQVSVVGEGDAQVLELRELREVSASELSTSGPPGSQLRFDGARLTMTVGGSVMPNSRSVVYYTVGEWAFDCE